MARTRARYVVGVLAILLCDAGPALAQAKTSASVVKVEAKANHKPNANGKQTITITIDIEKGWHIYANPVENDELLVLQTKVRITSEAKLEAVKIEYPAGKSCGEEDEKFKIYEDKVTIKAQVKRARGDNGPLRIEVKLQGKNNRQCLIPATITKEVR